MSRGEGRAVPMGRGYSCGRPLSTAAQDETALLEVGHRVLERGEVPRQQLVQRAAVRAAGPDPAAQQLGAGLFLRAGEQAEQDAELRPVVELAGQQLERGRVERPDQLLVGEPQQLLKLRRADFPRRRPRRPSRR